MKPESIIKLEESLNIKIYSLEEIEKIDIFNKPNNSYSIDENNNVIALIISNLNIKIESLNDFSNLKILKLNSCKIEDITFLNNIQNLELIELNNNLIQNISVFSNLKKIKEIDLTQNLIEDFNALITLPNLRTLRFGKNPCKDISFLKQLVSLKHLDFSYFSSYYEEIKFDFITQLPNLEGLTLIFNNIKDISFLRNSKKLKYLSLSYNQIEDLTVLSELKELKQLYLIGNFINDIELLKNLTDLETLNLDSNKINNISSLRELKKIKELSLDVNFINDIETLKNLSDLETLNLNSNSIDNISSLRELRKLKNINLGNNAISDITDLLKNESIKSVNLKGNKKIEIDFPKEVLEAGWEAIKQYSEKSKENVAFKNVKVLLLGNPNIGKSNLLEYLETNQVPVKNDSTHGVKYKQLVLNDINFHVWDFGGQEYFHATHKLFFSPNALNVVLWGKDIPRDSTESENIFFDLNYWLRTVEQLNCHSEKEEVLVVENKIDLNEPPFLETVLNQKDYSENFKILSLSFANLSLLNLKRTDIFKSIFIEKAENIISKFNYPAFYEVFWRRIQELDKDFVTVEEINNRPHKENVIAALKVFHNMGMLLYFHNLIKEKVFCNPQVLLDLLYEKVLGKEKKDRLTKQEIKESILNNPLDLSLEDVIKLLKHFDLVFEIKDEKDVYFIPQYLKPINSHILDLKNQIFKGCNIKIFGDNYLMSIAMLKIFSRYGTYVCIEENEYRFWRNGIIIKKDDSILMIEFNREKQTIDLYQDIGNKNINLQKEIVDFVLDLPEKKYFNLNKRHYENHIEKRKIDYLGDFMKSGLVLSLDEYQQYQNNDYNQDYSWYSKFFSVFVSIDYEYFIKWETLKKSIEIQKVKTKNFEGEEKVENVSCYSKYLNIEEIKFVKQDLKNDTKYAINLNVQKLEVNELIMGDKFNISGDNPNSQFGGKKNVLNNYRNKYDSNGIVNEIKEILYDLKSSEQINEEWRKNFTDAYIEMSKLEEADEERTETKSVSYLKNFFVNAKEVKDWVGIALLPVEIVSKGEKMLSLGKQLFNLEI